MNTPLLSIGLPVYNSEEYLEDVIDSLLGQSFSNFELIISDDNSIDTTFEICKRFSTIDNRINLIRQNENLGMVRNQNYVLQKASGKYFMWAAHDDVYERDFVLKLVSLLEENSYLASAFCNTALFSKSPINIKKILKLNFSNKSTLIRLAKFTYKFNDAHFYGIHRRDILINTEVPIWWGKNRITPANSNYPVLYYLLSYGNYGFIDGPPLFFKRQKKENYSLGPSNTLYQQISFLILRKINLFTVSCQNVYKAHKNAFITFSLALVILIRLSYDISISIIYFIKVKLQKSE